MKANMLRVLAVADPAVSGYVDQKNGLLESYKGQVSMDVVPWDVYYDTMMGAFAGKEEYDIVMAAGHLWKCDFAEKEYLEELRYDMEDILPVIESEMWYKNKCYLSPSFCDGHMIVYRKSVMRKVTGKELKQVITPQEYIETAKKLHESGYQIGMKAAASEIFTDALPFLRMNGSDVYGEDGAPCCATSEVVSGLESYCRLKRYAQGGTELFGNEEIADRIKNKEVAMAVTWSGQMGVVWEQDCIEKEDLGFATFSTAWNVTWSFGINRNSKQKERAAELLEYLRIPAVDWTAGITSGAPVRRASYEKGRAKFPWYSCQLEMFKYAKALPDMLNAGEKNNLFYREIHKAFVGEISAATAMEHVQRGIEQM